MRLMCRFATSLLLFLIVILCVSVAFAKDETLKQDKYSDAVVLAERLKQITVSEEAPAKEYVPPTQEELAAYKEKSLTKKAPEPVKQVAKKAPAVPKLVKQVVKKEKLTAVPKPVKQVAKKAPEVPKIKTVAVKKSEPQNSIKKGDYFKLKEDVIFYSDFGRNKEKYRIIPRGSVILIKNWKPLSPYFKVWRIPQECEPGIGTKYCYIGETFFLEEINREDLFSDGAALFDLKISEKEAHTKEIPMH